MGNLFSCTILTQLECHGLKGSSTLPSKHASTSLIIADITNRRRDHDRVSGFFLGFSVLETIYYARTAESVTVHVDIDSADLSLGSIDLDECIARLYKKELLADSVIEAICAKTKELLMKESNVVHVQAPVTVVGDIHGQFFDMIEIFKIGGFCPDTNYLFLGDYVDRGLFSVETISLLVCLKLRYPQRVHLIRGNHESRGVTQSYGFYTECSRKYGNAAVWHYFTDMFDYLSLSCVIDDKIFCVHGGLSPSIHSIDQIKIIDRFREIPHEGPMADLVWSDPDADRDEFSLSPRGAGYTFGAQVVKKFLEVNSMNHILRAHQLCNEGYMVMFDDRLSTVWSAPNYCYRCGNKASVLEVGPGGERLWNVFDAAPENDEHRLEAQQQQQHAGNDPIRDYFL